jgi:hypothetical protein
MTINDHEDSKHHLPNFGPSRFRLSCTLYSLPTAHGLVYPILARLWMCGVCQPVLLCTGPPFELEFQLI